MVLRSDDGLFYAVNDGDVVSAYEPETGDVYLNRSEASIDSLAALGEASYDTEASGWTVKAEKASEAESVGEAVRALLPMKARPINEEILERTKKDTADRRDEDFDMTTYRAATAPIGMDHGADDLG